MSELAGDAGTPMRILIAEDDAVSRRLLQAAVERLGHECSVAADGEQAWELWRAARPQVLISDWMMPGIDGVELCRRIRGATGPYCYVILLTALGDRDHVLAGMQAGADDYLRKPLDHEELRARLVAGSRVTALHGRLVEREHELELLNDRLRVESRRDPLTQLGNRLRLHEDLEVLHANAHRYGHGFSIGLCDVDRFKAYNDRYGHIAGDEVLRAVAASLKRHCRRTDGLYRYGGEEILVVLPEQKLETAALALERRSQEVAELGIEHTDNSPFCVVTLSAGVAEYDPELDGTPDAVLRRADAALYGAKAAGRNIVLTHEGAVARMV